MPFKPGQSGNPGGKRKGTQNKITPEIRSLAQNLFDQKYWKAIKSKLDEGTLHPSLEAKLWSYAYGEPKSQEQPGSGLTVQIGFLQLPGSTTPPTLALPDVTIAHLPQP
jgi:hypothetical protein